ncbi:MAG TPA: alpha/beta family hydrolase [Actinomycetota bacterium]|nr:alpha/beta family hydrolase [Actinomycetota bacterium]
MPTIETESGPVSAIVDGEGSGVVVVLAHGAGSPMDSEFMTHVATGIAAAGYLVCRFNFPYMEAGRRAPDRAPVLEGSYRSVVAWVRSRSPEARVVVGGKSMGGRIASHIAVDDGTLAGVLLHGYPLHPPGRPDRIRDAHLKGIGAPILFVEGTRDPFCPLETLEKVLRELPAARLAVIDDGDHSFKVRKASGRSTRDAWDEVVAASVSWLETLS